VLAPTLTPRLVDRFGDRRVTLAGFACAAAAYALFLRVGANWPYAAMLPTFVLIGVAFTLAYGTLTIAATDGVPESHQGLAGGVLTSSFQFGAALGLAVAAAVLAAATPGPELTLEGFRAALVVPLLGALVGLATSVSGLRPRRTARAVNP
jgi:predicted MFS family arabinose efflux permease